MSPTVAAGIAQNGFTASGVVVAPVVVVVAAVAMEEVVVAAVAMEEVVVAAVAMEEVVVAAMGEVVVFAARPPLVQEPLAPLTKWNMTDISALTAMDGTSASASLFWVCLLYTQLMGSLYTTVHNIHCNTLHTVHSTNCTLYTLHTIQTVHYTR